MHRWHAKGVCRGTAHCSQDAQPGPSGHCGKSIGRCMGAHGPCCCRAWRLTRRRSGAREPHRGTGSLQRGAARSAQTAGPGPRGRGLSAAENRHSGRGEPAHAARHGQDALRRLWATTRRRCTRLRSVCASGGRRSVLTISMLPPLSTISPPSTRSQAEHRGLSSADESDTGDRAIP